MEYQNKIENDSIIEAMRRDGLRATWIDPVFSEKVRDKMKAEAWPKMIKRMRDPASVEQIIKRLDEFHIEWVKSHKK